MLKSWIRRFVFRSAPVRSSTVAHADKRSSADKGRPASSKKNQLDLALLVAGLPAGERERLLQRLCLVVGKHSPWTAGDVVGTRARQCQAWAPLPDAWLGQQTAPGLVLQLATDVEFGLRTLATPLKLLSRIVRHVWLLHQGRRIGQAYTELARQLGDEQQALEQVWLIFARL